MGIRSYVRDIFFNPNVRAYAAPQALMGPIEWSGSWSDDPGNTYKPADLGSYITTSNSVYVCARYRSQLLASVPLRLYKGNPQKKKEVTTGPLYDLLGKVNPFWTNSRLLEMTELSLCLWGSAYWAYAGNNRGPQEIWWMPSDQMKVIKSATKYIDHFEFDPLNGNPPIRFETNEIAWFRYPNPLNEFDGLSPLMAAALAADTGRSAQVSNLAMFRNGMNPGGFLFPATDGSILTEEQAKGIEESLSRKFKGGSNAHKWAVLRGNLKMQPSGINPKDAEYIAGLGWSFDEVARSYGVPTDLIGGNSTYNNVNDARIAIWTETMKPEASFIANELTEQLLPLFPGQADFAEFDLSEVSVLQDDLNQIWDRARNAFTSGILTLNDARAAIDLLPVKGEIGDAFILPRGSAYVDEDGELIADTTGKGDVSALDGSVPPLDPGTPPAAPPKALPPGKGKAKAGDISPDDAEAISRAIRGLPPKAKTRASFPAYGSDEHRSIMSKADAKLAPHEEEFGTMCADLMRKQKQSINTKMSRKRDVAEPVTPLQDGDGNIVPFDRAKWIKQFRQASRPVFQDIVQSAGDDTMDELGISGSFNVKDPNVVRFLEQRAQRFAEQVNETTWDMLKASLLDGINNSETMDQLAGRVNDVMGDRIRSSKEVISRTEVLGAYSGGSLQSAKQSGVVEKKRWYSALDDRVRPDHADAHGQTVDVDDDFEVGDASGQGPGMMGDPAQDCNCRCVCTFVTDTDSGDEG
jgi:HK97 family phage portal protein